MPRHPLRSKTILLVDDSESVRACIAESLESEGVQVLQASNGAEAIRTLARHPGFVDLLLTDIEMPQMSGWDLAAKIAESRPAIRVVYMSAGISSSEWNDSKDKRMGTYFIEKPFELKDLKRLLASILAN